MATNNKTNEFAGLVLEVLRNQQSTLDRLVQAVFGGDVPGLREAMATSQEKIAGLEVAVDANGKELSETAKDLTENLLQHSLLARAVEALAKEQDRISDRKRNWFDEVVRGLIIAAGAAALAYLSAHA